MFVGVLDSQRDTLLQVRRASTSWSLHLEIYTSQCSISKPSAFTLSSRLFT